MAGATLTPRGKGWKRDPPDHRDLHFAADDTPRPDAADLRPLCPAVYDQGHLGSCTGNVVAGCIEFELMKQGCPVFTPSRLFIYYNERSMEGSVAYDSGAYLRDGFKTAAAEGVCPEDLWPYQISRFREEPPPSCYTEALLHQVTEYLSVPQSASQIEACIAAGWPVGFGFSVPTEFESSEMADTGQMEMPSPNSATNDGHVMMLVGYDRRQQVFIARNSWSSSWGMQGYCELPYAFVLSSDWCASFWTVRMVEAGGVPAPLDPNTIIIPLGGPWPLPLDTSKIYRLAPGNWRTLSMTDLGGTLEKPIRIGFQNPAATQAAFRFFGETYVEWIP